MGSGSSDTGAAVAYNTMPRTDIFQAINERGLSPVRILSIGAGCGATEEALKAQYGSYVVGIEVDQELASQARDRLDEIIVTDVETYEFPPDIGRFDLILCTDVLEHLRKPEALLDRVKRVLEPDGLVAICVPNVRYWHAIYTLVIKGDWRYSKSGLFDASHLRWFTRKSLDRLITQNGLEVVYLMRKKRFTAATPWRSAVIRALSLLLPHDFFAYQFLVLARNIPPQSQNPTTS